MTQDEQRYKALRQALQLVRALAGRPRSLYELSDDLRLSPRSVRRYLTSLRGAGVDVRAFAGDGRAHRYAIDRVSWLALLDLPSD